MTSLDGAERRLGLLAAAAGGLKELKVFFVCLFCVFCRGNVKKEERKREGGGGRCIYRYIQG